MQSCAATGANTSRPANVAPGAGRCQRVSVSSTARSAPPAKRHGGSEQPVVGTDEHALAAGHLDRDRPAGRGDAGVDHREHDAGRDVADAAGEGERSASHVEGRDRRG